MAEPFFWYELMTSDVDAAARFYAEVVGWQAQDFPMPGARYTIVGIGERGVAGIMAVPEGSGLERGWLGYVHTDDVDAAVARLETAGGAVLSEPQDIPGGVGRFATVADPQGAVFMLMKPQGPDTPAPSPATPGAVGWRELHAADGPGAFDFYAGQFGWTSDGQAPVGMQYLLFSVDGAPHGGVMTRMNPASAPGWIFYFTVEAIDAAVARAEAAGGRLVHGPHPVPGGSWVASLVDPQGVAFSLTAATR